MTDDRGQRDPAASRYAVIAATRLAGAGLTVAGIVLVARSGEMLGLPLMLAGLAMFAVVPMLLARRWKSPSSEGPDGPR